jgi:DNA-3-methyladenine glycosylase I
MSDNKIRCDWSTSDEIYIKYHDTMWGVPVHDDRTLFEFLVLEGAQAGLSWITILKRIDSYRELYDNFDIEKVASYTEQDIERLKSNPGIIRNRLKIKSSIANAKGVLKIQEEFGSFDNYLWGFVNHSVIDNHRECMEVVPATSPISDALSKDLKKRGFSFVGSTIMYAFMQAIGMVNDHIVTCFRYNEVKNLSR